MQDGSLSQTHLEGSHPWVSDTRADAIDEVLKLRDEYVVIRERLFHVTAAAAARIKKVDGQLMDCATAGRVFGARIDPRNRNNVFTMPGHPYLASLEDELENESSNRLW